MVQCSAAVVVPVVLTEGREEQPGTGETGNVVIRVLRGLWRRVDEIAGILVLDVGGRTGGAYVAVVQGGEHGRPAPPPPPSPLS